MLQTLLRTGHTALNFAQEVGICKRILITIHEQRLYHVIQSKCRRCFSLTKPRSVWRHPGHRTDWFVCSVFFVLNKKQTNKKISASSSIFPFSFSFQQRDTCYQTRFKKKFCSTHSYKWFPQWQRSLDVDHPTHTSLTRGADRLKLGKAGHFLSHVKNRVSNRAVAAQDVLLHFSGSSERFGWVSQQKALAQERKLKCGEKQCLVLVLQQEIWKDFWSTYWLKILQLKQQKVMAIVSILTH